MKSMPPMIWIQGRNILVQFGGDVGRCFHDLAVLAGAHVFVAGLAAGEGEQRRDVACVGCLQGGDIALPGLTGINQAAAAPGKPRLA